MCAFVSRPLRVVPLLREYDTVFILKSSFYEGKRVLSFWQQQKVTASIYITPLIMSWYISSQAILLAPEMLALEYLGVSKLRHLIGNLRYGA